MKITKKEIVSAVLKERLIANRFFDTNVEECKVCAVGAVLRAKKFKNDMWAEKITNGNFTSGHIYKAHKDFEINKNTFLGVLSTEFEGYDEFEKYYASEDDLRLHALMIIEGFCPDEIVVDL